MNTSRPSHTGYQSKIHFWTEQLAYATAGDGRYSIHRCTDSLAFFTAKHAACQPAVLNSDDVAAFRAYLKVQKSGAYNMVAESTAAAEEAGLTSEQYHFVIRNYAALAAKYEVSKPREANDLIARFMGLSYAPALEEYYVPAHNSGDWTRVADLKYDTDWNWLVPVVQKCYLAMPEGDSDARAKFGNALQTGGIGGTYHKVVEFIVSQES